jgi:hypothetical protein
LPAGWCGAASLSDVYAVFSFHPPSGIILQGNLQLTNQLPLLQEPSDDDALQDEEEEVRRLQAHHPCNMHFTIAALTLAALVGAVR